MRRPTILLFDVDGTLITTGGVGRGAIESALERQGAGGGASFSFAGMTDRAIVRQGLENAGRNADEATIDAVMVDYLGGLQQAVDDADAARYRVHAGMREVLDALADRPGLALGLGTGNVERGARIKLQRVALSERFAFGGFGCDSESRPALIRAGAVRGAAQLGEPLGACRVVVIGDTPKDIAAAQANGAECVAVATGVIGRHELAQHAPTFLFDDLSDPGALAALMGESVSGSA